MMVIPQKFVVPLCNKTYIPVSQEYQDDFKISQKCGIMSEGTVHRSYGLCKIDFFSQASLFLGFLITTVSIL